MDLCPHTGSGVVMRPVSFIDSSAVQINWLLTYLFTFLRIGLFRFPAGAHRQVTKPGCSFLMFILCYSRFCYGCMFAFVALDLALLY